MFLKIIYGIGTPTVSNTPDDWPARNEQITIKECKEIDSDYCYSKTDKCEKGEREEHLFISVDNGSQYFKVPTGKIITKGGAKSEPSGNSIYVMSDEGKTIDRLL